METNQAEAAAAVSDEADAAQRAANEGVDDKVCEPSEPDCIPEHELPEDLRALLHAGGRAPGLEVVDLKPPPPIEALQNVRSIPEGTLITLHEEPGGRSGLEFTVTVDEGRNLVIEDHGSFLRVDDQDIYTARIIPLEGGLAVTGEPWKKSRRITNKQMRQLLSHFGDIGFLDITQQSLDDSCVAEARHSNYVTITLRFQGRETKIKHRHGCNPGRKSDLQLELAKLESTIKEVAKVDDFQNWVAKQAIRAKRAAEK